MREGGKGKGERGVFIRILNPVLFGLQMQSSSFGLLAQVGWASLVGLCGYLLAWVVAV